MIHKFKVGTKYYNAANDLRTIVDIRIGHYKFSLKPKYEYRIIGFSTTFHKHIDYYVDHNSVLHFVK